MKVQIPVQLTPMQYRALLAVCEKRGTQAHVLIAQLVEAALDPSRRPKLSHYASGKPIGRQPIPVTDGERAQIRDGNFLLRSDKVLADELGWSETRVRRVREEMGLPTVTQRKNERKEAA